MGEQTGISWTDSTFNPWWGCERVSPGCQHCYAETFAKRTGKAVWGKNAPRRFFGEKHWSEPLRWNRKAEASGERHLVFCASMADVFEDRDDLVAERERLFDLIEETPHLTWQLLTKRPENVVEMSQRWSPWPKNAWIGTTAEDQTRFDMRIEHLLDVDASVRFLSCEPLLGPVEIGMHRLWCPCDSHTGNDEGLWECDSCRAVHRSVVDPDGPIYVCSADGSKHRKRAEPVKRGRLIDWVIVGGESGAGYRLMDLEHARSIRDQCYEAGTPFFFKQVGGFRPTDRGNRLDGELHQEFPTWG